MQSGEVDSISSRFEFRDSPLCLEWFRARSGADAGARAGNAVFVVAVRYGAADRPAWERDLPAIRSLGFTAIVVPDERVESIRAIASPLDLIVIRAATKARRHSSR